MKKLNKIIFFFILTILPFKVLAYSISNTENININNLRITNLKFLVYSNYPSSSFGIMGNIQNNNDNDNTFNIKTTYYDKNQTLLATKINQITINPHDSISYRDLNNLNIIKNGYNVDDIASYQIEVENLKKTSNILPSQTYLYTNYDYIIDRYDVNIKVKEDNSLDIVETIDAYFNTYKHGIIRTIPIKNKIVRQDGSKYVNIAKIKDIQINNLYSSSKYGSDYQFKIGDENKEVIGPVQYVIKYTYALGNDKTKSYDELYYNIIGTEWDTIIGNVSFDITLPKEFDSSKLGFSKGKYGSTNSDNINYQVNGKNITGQYDGILSSGEGLTVRLELPEGYFLKQLDKAKIAYCILLIFPFIFTIISYLLWKKHGKDDEVVETVEFYPPNNFNSLEIGFLYKGTASNIDVTSLLIYLANQGYLKIEEIKILYKKNGFKITKLKEYTGNNENEKLFFDGLFECSSNKQVVTDKDLYNKFYLTTDEILHNINSSENKKKIFENTSFYQIVVVIMMILTFLLISIFPMYIYGNEGYIIVSLIFPSMGFIFASSILFNPNATIYINGVQTYSKVATVIFAIIFGFMFGGIPFLTVVLPILIIDTTYFIGYIIGIITIICMLLSFKFLKKRNAYGNEILGKIKGFKNFLETAEKPKLEQLVMENPTYFYDILPYTYVLNVSDKWIKKFETINIEAPSWYSGSDYFDMFTFNSFINSTMNSANSSMSSSSSSGGGISGGGSGGGGGSSW